METRVTNNLPTFYIVSDTKINPQTLERFLKDSGKESILKNWNNSNKDQQVSSLEQHIEIMARVYGISNSDLKNDEFLKEVLKNPSLTYLLDHASITVMFNKVSLNFLMLLLRLRLDNTNFINEKTTLDELGFWLPHLLDKKENKAFALQFASGFSKIAKSMEELANGFGYEDLKEEAPPYAEIVRQIINRLTPISSQINVGLTCSVRAWRNMIIMGANFASDEELRYIFLHLSKEMKRKYFGVFQDMKLENDKGERLGLDSLRSDESWFNFQIVSDPN